MSISEEMSELLEEGAAILREAGAREVYVFGSVASGRIHEGSDVDLAVSGLPPEVFYATMARLSTIFETSVDLVDLDEVNPFTTYLRTRGVLQRVA